MPQTKRRDILLKCRHVYKENEPNDDVVASYNERHFTEIGRSRQDIEMSGIEGANFLIILFEVCNTRG